VISLLGTEEVIFHMEARAEFFHRMHLPRIAAQRTSALAARSRAGMAGGLALAAPLMIYDWARSSHSALELPMAATSWLFGLDHYARNGYHWWPIVLGAVLLLAYWALHGLAFGALAAHERLTTRAGMVAAGLAWGFVSFVFFWTMLLPIARDGAPFRATAAAPGLLVAPAWVWILGYALLGLVTGLALAALRRER
jgi:hypothetical protein